MGFQQYTASHKKWDHVGNITPNVELMEGVRPSIFYPAAYLPAIRFDKYYEDFIVVSAGKVVALDNSGFAVPAGLAIDATTVDATYVQSDEDEGITGPNGTAVTAGDTVNSLIGSVTFSKPVGVAPYNYIRLSGSDPNDPSTLRYHNYSMQNGVAILMDYVLELPIVSSYTPVFAGIAAATGSFSPGDLVETDSRSNFAPHTAAAGNYDDVIGQVLKVDTDWPKDYLNRVRTAFGTPGVDLPDRFQDPLGNSDTTGVLERMPGTANAGLPDAITYAGGSATLGMAIINLIFR